MRQTPTPKQSRFCNEYIIDHDATNAAIRAGYSRRTAGQIGYQLLQKTSIKAMVEKLEKAVLKRLQASADKVLAEWSNLGFSDPGAILWKPGELDSNNNPTREGTIKPLHEMPPEVRRTIRHLKFDNRGRPEFSFWDKAPYQSNLGKYHRLIRERIELSATVGLAERMKAAEARMAKYKKKEMREEKKNGK